MQAQKGKFNARFALLWRNKVILIQRFTIVAV